MKSDKGLGTTVKVSLPLRALAPTPSTIPQTSSMDSSSLPASVCFFGFNILEPDPTKEPTKAKANRWLLRSMKRYCTQIGLPVYVADDNLNSNATIHVISEQALEKLIRNVDKSLGHSVLSAESLQAQLIVICNTRNSALELRAGRLHPSLPNTTQYLWLPIGPAKLADALSTCYLYHETDSLDALPVQRDADMHSTCFLRGDCSHTAVEAASHVVSNTAGEDKDFLQTPPSIDTDTNLQHQGGGDASSANLTNTFDDVDLQAPQPARLQRSGSEVFDKPIFASLPLRVQMNRSSTTPSVSTGALSLLLVDDNVIDPPRLFNSGFTNHLNSRSISDCSRSSLKTVDTFTLQRRTARRLWKSMKVPQNKSVQMTLIEIPSWPSSQKSC